MKLNEMSGKISIGFPNFENWCFETFDAVFLKKLNDYFNTGIKVSPTIREWIFNRGFLLIGKSCCPVIDR